MVQDESHWLAGVLLDQLKQHRRSQLTGKEGETAHIGRLVTLQTLDLDDREEGELLSDEEEDDIEVPEHSVRFFEVR